MKGIIFNILALILTGITILPGYTVVAASPVDWPASSSIEGPQSAQAYTLAQTLSDEAQRTTLAFAGLAIMTGNLEAQSFFPPGKVADYTGFQYLRDNDPDSMDRTVRQIQGIRHAGPGSCDIEPGGNAKKQSLCIEHLQHRAGADANSHAVAQPTDLNCFKRCRRGPGAGAVEYLRRTGR